MKNYPHLVQRNTVFYARMRLPVDTREQSGFSEFKHSLRTADLEIARYRYHIVINSYLQLITWIRNMHMMDKNQIRKVIAGFFEEVFDDLDHDAYIMPKITGQPFPHSMTFERAKNICNNNIEKYTQELVKRKYSKPTISGVKEVLRNAGINDKDIDQYSSNFEYTCELYARSYKANYQALMQKYQGNYDEADLIKQQFLTLMNAISKQVQVQETPAPVEVTSRHNMDKAFAEFVNFNCKSGHWKGYTEKTSRRQYEMFKMIVGADGNTSIEDINFKEHIKPFRDKLLNLPKNLNKISKLKNKSIEEILEDTNATKVSGKTAKNYFILIKGFFKWCVAEQDLETIPFPDGFNLKLPKNASVKRPPYSIEDLKFIFNSPQYRGHKSSKLRGTKGVIIRKDEKYWIPLIALYTGMRMNEITSLHCEDIRTETVGGNEYIFFDVNENSKGNDNYEVKSLKTEQSTRKVPIHSELIKMGFLEYVDKIKKLNNKDKRLFFQITVSDATGRSADTYTKQYAHYTKSIGFKKPGCPKCFHSFRHGFKDALKNGHVTSEYSHALMGHEDGDVHASYGTASYPLDILKQEIEKIDFGDLDLSHLYV